MRAERARAADHARLWSGVALISFSAVFVRLAGVEPARSAFLRIAYALPVYAVLLAVLAARRRDARLLPLAVLGGAMLGADLLAWHEAIGILGAGLGTLMPNIQVVFVGVAGVVLFGERPHPVFWAALPVVLLGVWTLAAAGRPIVAGGSVLAGVGYGIATAAFYAGFLVVLRLSRLRRPGSGWLVHAASATVGAFVVTGAAAAAQGVAAPAGSWEANGWLVALALGSQVAGWGLLTSSIHRVPAATTSVALLVQPVLALAWGALLLGEPLGLAQLGGAAIVLAGVAAAHTAVARGAAPAEPGPA